MCEWIRSLSIIKISVLPKLVYRLNRIPIKILWKKKKHRTESSQNNFEKEEQNWKTRLALNQDGRVEGRALTPSCENTRITTSCWTIIDRKTLEFTKKDTPHPKTKEKPQWDGRRGTITVKSNPITAGWVTHRLENTYTTEVHPLEWTFWAPRQTSQPGCPEMGGEITGESDFEA